jgi:hypothetical protein
VALDASKRWLALALFLSNVALQVLDRRVAGRVGASSRSEGEREGWRAPEGSGRPPLSACVNKTDG